MKALSLFSGAGGMDVGAKQSGFQVMGACELEPNAVKTFRVNHPEVLMVEGDINQHMNDLKDFSDIDLVFGGPPCQGFSVAGKMKLDDPRSRLVFSFCDIIDHIKPRAFVMENVKALGSLKKFHAIKNDILKRFQASGYSVISLILNAKDFGVPQSRERVFFVGFRNKSFATYLINIDKRRTIAPNLRQVIKPLGIAGCETNPNITKAKITFAKKPVLRKSPYAGMLFNGQGRPLNPDSWSSTLPASMGGNRTPIIDEDHLYYDKPSWVEQYHRKLVSREIIPEYGNAPARLRRLTIDEAALIQTFPRNYIFSGSQSKIFTQIGNAVPCLLAKAIMGAVKQSLNH